MSRPLLLDLFCCQGGAAVGYDRAGLDVVGVDVELQPRYPFEFHRADALEFLKSYGKDFDAVHASPPCQAYSLVQHANGKAGNHPRLIEPLRNALERLGLPYVIENVPGAPLLNAVQLCGEQFGLGVIRHRLFETNWPLTVPTHPRHRGRVRGWRHGTFFDGPYVAVYGEGGGKGSTEEWSTAMGIDWMSRDGLREAIPPAYTEHIGAQLLEHLRSVAA